MKLSCNRNKLVHPHKAKMSEQPKPDLGLLEDDDEFEEFPAEGSECYMLLMQWHFLVVGHHYPNPPPRGFLRFECWEADVLVTKQF